MDKNYIYDGMRLYNMKGKEIVVENVEWKDEDKSEGYIHGYFMENLSKKNFKTSRFLINTMGEFLFYKVDEIRWKNNIEILKEMPKYAKYSRKVKESIKKEQENRRKKTYKLRKEMIKRNELHDKLKHKYGFDGFIHTTNFSNFINIMDKGYIYSRCKAKGENLLNIDSADEGVISGTSKYVQRSVRFYYRVKTPTHYRNEGIAPGNPEYHMPIPVMLVAGKDIYKYYDILYTDGNARSGITKKSNKAKCVYNYNFDRIFSQGDYNYCSYEEKREITRQRNAELLVPDRVSLKVINKIIFRSDADFKMANILFGDDPRFIVNKNRFFNKNQYCEDYFIIVDNNKIKYRFKLNKYDEHSIRQFNHTLRCEFKSSIIEYDLSKHTTYIVPKYGKYNIVGVLNIGNASSDLKSIEYLIDGHVSAIWRR